MASSQETMDLSEGPGPSNRLTHLADACPHVLENIVRFMDDETMETLRLVCSRLESYMDNESKAYKESWERRWMGTIRYGSYKDFLAAWKAAVLRRPLRRIRAWALACERYFQAAPVHRAVSKSQVHPLHVAAADGSMELCRAVLAESRGPLNPRRRRDGATPLHFAAQYGHLEVLLSTFTF